MPPARLMQALHFSYAYDMMYRLRKSAYGRLPGDSGRFRCSQECKYDSSITFNTESASPPPTLKVKSFGSSYHIDTFMRQGHGPIDTFI